MQATAALPQAVLRFLDALPGLKHHPGGYWTARCPAHDDGTPSLSVRLGDRGLLLKCFVGCKTEDVMRALKLPLSDLFFEPRKEQGPWEPAARPQVVCRYDYRDERGQPLYRVLRYEPKGFSQEWLDPEAGKWRPGLHPTVRRVLYRLPELLADPGRWVVVVEGERKADLLAGLGFVATTKSGGAGSLWLADYSLCLSGRPVVVVADPDPPGLRAAEATAGSLLRHGCRLLRLVPMSGLPKLSRWLEQLPEGQDRALAVRRLLDVPAWGPKGV